ncbi:MAG TPA: aldehyde dehydrogenase family protein [Thiolapillus brandeum]|uniref:Aldehyde dehydrogenase family protein n=1 Tax=Thiolapillus brandeum TaxID=1076588 RepID=A0A831WAS5_9GAMM|nr:aldehyde dehydrogenase family protein [Thiolapillus brandeum]
MNTHVSLGVPGAVPAGQPLSVTSPYDGSLLATVDVVDEDGVGQALQNAFAAFDDRRQWLSAARRIGILEKTASLMEQHFNELVTLAAREGGKPLMDSRVEVLRAIDGVKNCIECIRTGHGTEIPMQLNAASANRLAFTRREPIGVVVAFSAFNHPLNLIVHQVGPAVASGCPVIIKPAEDTPLSAFRFVELLREAGLPESWCQPLLTTGHPVSAGLAADRRVAFFSFIGSARVGWMLRSQLAPGTRCALEHGGVAPVVITADADLDDVLPLLAKGGFYHAGQVCVSVQRVFAHASIAQEVAARLAEIGGRYRAGDPLDENTEIGPLIRHQETDRIESWVNEAVEGGAVLVGGGRRQGEAFFEATVLHNPPPDAKVSRNEIFGPVICVYDWRELDAAIEMANDVPYAFQASVCTRDIDTALYVSSNLQASAVMVNDHTAFRVDWMPFAGLKESGYGVGGIPYTYRDMQIEKLTVIRSKSVNASFPSI